MKEDNRLTVKKVPFMGNELMAAKDEKSGKIYAGVSYICKGIGLTESQKDTQVQKIQKDVVLCKGAKNLPLKFHGQVRNIQCIDNEFIPLWLAKITITPAMQKEHPEVADKLVQYQLKAQKVLADAFLHHKTVPQPSTLTALEQTVEVLKGMDTRIATLETKQAALEQVVTNGPKDWLTATRERIENINGRELSRCGLFLAPLYDELEKSANVNLSLRQSKQFKKLRARGEAFHRGDVSKLWLISLDERLKTAFDAILDKQVNEAAS